MKYHKHIIAATVATVCVAAVVGGGIALSPKQTLVPIPAPAVQSQCDPTLWNYVYHPARLPTKDDCRVVSGVVQWDKIEPDGDFHIRLQLDDPNSAPVNAKNIGGYLVVEPICQQTPTQADAIQPCSTYAGPKFALPAVGSHVSVTGYYTLDAQHGWMEIHSVSAITSL